jgi:hypothetical protein
MSELPPPVDYWQASDGNWYPPYARTWPPVSTDPPSGPKAMVWTVLSAVWLWFLLPVAVHYTRKARREADASEGRYVWSRSLLHRPVLLWLVVLAAEILMFAVMIAAGYGDN